MIGIIMEGALFVALIATVAALLFYALLRWTPLGLRLRQDRNRRQIEHALDLECPIHRVGGGVDKTPLSPGLHARNPLTTGIEEYPTFMQTLVLARNPGEASRGNDEINVNSVEGQPLSLDVSMSFELDPMRVPALYSTFRTDIATIQHTYVKQAIRQALQEVVGNEEIAAIIGPRRRR